MEEDSVTQPLLINSSAESCVRLRPGSDGDQQRSSSLKLTLLNVVVFFYFFGLYPMQTSTDQYIKQAVTESLHLNNLSRNREDCLSGNHTHFWKMQLKIESESSTMMIAVNIAGLVPQFFVTFLLGPCSDQIGRKIALILPLFGSCIKAVIFSFVSFYSLNSFFLCVGSFIEGTFGGFSLFFAACVAYTADLTNFGNRSFWICLLDVVTGLSIVVTNVVGGYIITFLGFTWLFLILAVTFALAKVLVVVAVKESISVRSRVQIFTTQHMKRAIRVYSVDNGTNRRWKLLTLLVVIILLCLGSHENSDASTFLLIGTPVCFTPEMLGFFLACLYVSKTVGALVVMKMNQCGVKEGGLLLISVASYIILQLFLAWAYHLETLFIGECLCLLFAFVPN